MFDAKQEDRSALAVVLFKFWTDHEEGPDGKLIAVDKASWGKRGYGAWETNDKVSRLIKTAKAARARPERTLCVWDALEEHYIRWKAGQDAVTDGYALEGWAGGISAAQIQACKAIHIYSVEDLSLATDEAIQKLGMGALKLRETARAFVASLNGEGAKLAKENAEMKAEIERLTKEADEDRKAMREFMAQHQIPTPDMPADAAGELATAKPTKVKKAA